MKLEADELCTAAISHPPGSAEQFALVMNHAEAGVKLVFFLTREDGHALAASIIEMVGYDA